MGLELGFGTTTLTCEFPGTYKQMAVDRANHTHVGLFITLCACVLSSNRKFDDITHRILSIRCSCSRIFSEHLAEH
jgi:hypothetical protein